MADLKLLGTIEAFEDPLVMAVGVAGEEAVVTISEDRTLKVWIKRSTGQYWPSISHPFLVVPRCLQFEETSLKLFVGLDSGVTMEFLVADDFNKLQHTNSYHGHSSRVTGIDIITQSNQVVTCSMDRSLILFSTLDSSLTAAFQHTAPLLSVRYHKNSYFFTGDNWGNVIILSWKQEKTFEKIKIIKKHTGSIREMLIIEKGSGEMLVTSSNDKTISLLNLKSQNYQQILTLSAHKNPIQSISFCSHSNQLISVSMDNILVAWNLNSKRTQMADWRESDWCEKCETPFYWNLRKMWKDRKLGVRQHHCRLCGQALCGSCCQDNIKIPKIGFEIETRVCSSCFQLIKDENQVPMATFYKLPQSPISVHVENSKKLIIIASKNRSLQIYDANL